MASATIIPLDDPKGTTLVEDLRCELARARRALGEAYRSRQDASGFTNALLEVHGSLDVVATLTEELSLRTEES